MELGPDELPVADASRLGGHEMASGDEEYQEGMESDDEVLSDDEQVGGPAWRARAWRRARALGGACGEACLGVDYGVGTRCGWR